MPRPIEVSSNTRATIVIKDGFVNYVSGADDFAGAAPICRATPGELYEITQDESGVFYLCASKAQIYFSDNSGVTWKPMPVAGV